MTIGRISYPVFMPMQNALPNLYAPAAKKKEPDSIFLSANGSKVEKKVAFGEYEQRIEAQNALVRKHEEAHRGASGPQASGSPVYETTTDNDGRLIITGGHQGVTLPQAIDKNSPFQKIKETITAAEFAEKGALAPQSFDELSDADKRIAQQSRAIRSTAQTALAERMMLQQKFGINPNQKPNPVAIAQTKTEQAQTNPFVTKQMATGQKLNLIA